MSTRPFVASTGTHDFHLRAASLTSEFSPNKTRQTSNSPTKRNKTGLLVSTAHKPPILEMSSFTSEDPLNEVDPTAFASWCSKQGVIETISESTTQVVKANSKLRKTKEKELLTKLKSTHKVRVTRKLGKKGEDENKPKTMKFYLDDADENLDLMQSDDEAFHFGCLSFGISKESNTLDIGIGKYKPYYKLASNSKSFDLSHGFELGNLISLRSKLIEIRFARDNGDFQTLGYIEYRMRKFRVYDNKNKLAFRIYRQASMDPKIQLMSIKTAEDVDFGLVTITHLNANISKCELSFLEGCDSLIKLLFISTLLIMMERVEVDPELFEKPSPPKSFFNSIFEFLTCQK